MVLTSQSAQRIDMIRLAAPGKYGAYEEEFAQNYSQEATPLHLKYAELGYDCKSVAKNFLLWQ